MDAKAAARERFESARDGLIDLGHRIHAHPELDFEEEQASSWLYESLTDAGFAVEKVIGDLPTAFRARAGSGPLHIGICAEYDCLPGIGHACGHNIITSSAVSAALAAAKVADDVGLTVSSYLSCGPARGLHLRAGVRAVPRAHGGQSGKGGAQRRGG